MTSNKSYTELNIVARMFPYKLCALSNAKIFGGVGSYSTQQATPGLESPWFIGKTYNPEFRQQTTKKNVADWNLYETKR